MTTSCGQQWLQSQPEMVAHIQQHVPCAHVMRFYYRFKLESLILAQNERWWRA
jgi:hypothetical protein